MEKMYWKAKMEKFKYSTMDINETFRGAIKELSRECASEERNAQLDIVVASIKYMVNDLANLSEWVEWVAECIKENDKRPSDSCESVGQYEDNEQNKVITPWDPVD